MSDKGPNIWVSPNGNNGWKVQMQGGPTVSQHNTQGDAINAARPLSRQLESELLIQRPNGEIRARDSHGHDPRSRRG